MSNLDHNCFGPGAKALGALIATVALLTLGFAIYMLVNRPQAPVPGGEITPAQAGAARGQVLPAGS